MDVIYAFYLGLAALIVVVLIRGDWPERAALRMFIAATVLSSVLTRNIRFAFITDRLPLFGWMGVMWWLCLVDTGLFVGLIALGIRSQRRWVLWVAAFQLVSLITHFGRAFDPTFDENAYAIMEGFSSIPALILLAVALYRHPRNRRPRRKVRQPS